MQCCDKFQKQLLLGQTNDAVQVELVTGVPHADA
jgi:hypothetical protein